MATLRDVNQYVEFDPALRIYKPVFWRRNMVHRWLMFDESDVPWNTNFTIPAAPALAPPVAWKQPYSSVVGLDPSLGTPLLVQSLVFFSHSSAGPPYAENTAASNYTVRLKEVGEARDLMNRECHVRTIFGTGQLPAVLREPFFFGSQHNLQAQFRKIAGAAVDCRHFLVGSQFYPYDPNFMIKPQDRHQMYERIRAWRERAKIITPYWLTTDTEVDLLANATGNFQAKVGDDGHFEAFGITAVSTGNFSLTISEVKTKQTLSNGAITRNNGIGNATLPYIFLKSYLVPSGYRLNFEITDLSGAPNSIYLTMFGRKIYAPFRQLEEIVKPSAPNVVPTMVDQATKMIPKPI